tara:strand:+ start:78 stop:563 length:486 start_codon:yes stop_codon:yes gene_type:complete
MKVFTETQRFDQWWMRILLVIVLAFAISPLIFQYDTLINSNVELVSVLVSILVLLAVFMTFWFLFKLQTRIDETGITYRFFPFQRKNRFKPWSEIQTISIRKYNPIKEYGGWGYRISFTKKKALTIKGNKGIQIIFKNGNELLLGTQHPEKVEQIIKNYLA